MFSKDNVEFPVKYSLYRSVFIKEYNLGFGNPRSDVCSYCECKKATIAATTSIQEKTQLMTVYRLHKMQASRFYSLLNHNDEPALNTMTIAFDIQQNQPLPKVSISEAFYARQIWLYNMTFVIHEVGSNGKAIQDKTKVFMYSWAETEAGKTSNECTSALLDFLQKELKDDIQLLRLFSDSCSAQNKNVNVLLALQHFVKLKHPNLLIRHYFPIRGHSYFPADRVFGRIEQELRKLETILLPHEYHAVMSQHGTVRIFGEDWHVSDYKSAVPKVAKSKLPFLISKARVIQISASSIGVKDTFSGDFCFHSILKRGMKLEKLSLTRLQKASHVKQPKAKDVAMLLQKLGVNDITKSPNLSLFYSCLSPASGLENNEDEVEEYDEPYSPDV